MRKKIEAFLLVILLAFSLAVSLNFAVADDDEDEEDDDKEEYSSEDRSSSPKTETKITTDVSTKTIIEKDSDGDGLLDQKDPHPAIPEIYIVIDEDKNGIVDKFEKK